MKLAMISDIHGNFHALESVLKDISAQGADKTYCLGDLATIGPQPTEVIEIIDGLGISSIMGNHDLALLDPEKAVELQIAPPLISSLHWCRERLNQTNLDFISGSKQYLQIDITSTQNILLYHGSPHSSTDTIMAETPNRSLDQYFSGFDSNILIGGHTHYQLVRQYEECVLVNPGSVGASFKGEVLPNSNPSINSWAEYAIIEVTDNGLSIDLRQVKYDIESYLSILRESDLPVKDWWISQISFPGN
jgi:putative phosphoesterase